MSVANTPHYSFCKKLPHGWILSILKLGWSAQLKRVKPSLSYHLLLFLANLVVLCVYTVLLTSLSLSIFCSFICPVCNGLFLLGTAGECRICGTHIFQRAAVGSLDFLN